ncbi:MAG TPA: hypothetical protein DCQ06_11680 [Myxococcales bacterium]|nr:hypothetical protein [Myxococcales bacterium]
MMTEFNPPYMKNLLLAAALSFVCTPIWAAPPTGPDQATVVLPPGVEKKIEAAFGRAAPTWKLESAKVQKDRVDAKVCAETCVELSLTDPKAACDGKTVGPWCVTYKGDTPSNIAALEAALAKDTIADVWKVIPARPAQPAEAPPEDAKEATGTQLETAGPQGSQGEKGQKGHSTPKKAGDNTTMLLVIALLSAAVATFALFRLRDEDEQEQASEDTSDEQEKASEDTSDESSSDETPSEASEAVAEQAAVAADTAADLAESDQEGQPSADDAAQSPEADATKDAVEADDAAEGNDDDDDDDGDDDKT